MLATTKTTTSFFLRRLRRTSVIGNCRMSSSSSHQTLLQRIQALDKSHLAPSYAAFVLFHPTSSSRYAVVGHAQKSFINSTLLQVKSENGQPIFVMEESSNKLIGTGNEILRLVVDIEYERNKSDSDTYNHDELFHQRTKAFEYATQHLLQNGVISRKQMISTLFTPCSIQ